jgi:hypothetical protein
VWFDNFKLGEINQTNLQIETEMLKLNRIIS